MLGKSYEGKQRRICSTSQGHIFVPMAGDHLGSRDGWGWQSSALHATLATQGCQGVVATLVIFVHWVRT